MKKIVLICKKTVGICALIVTALGTKPWSFNFLKTEIPVTFFSSPKQIKIPNLIRYQEVLAIQQKQVNITFEFKLTKQPLHLCKMYN